MRLLAVVLAGLLCATVAYGQGTCSDTWACNKVYEAGAGVVPSAPNGYISSITTPAACLQECLNRGLSSCNAVSVPKTSAGYQACHLWYVSDATVQPLANSNYRSIKINCATTTAQACNLCDGGTCSSPGTPPGNPPALPPPPPGNPPALPPPPPPPSPPAGPGTCSDAWSCNMVWEGTPATGAVVPSEPFGYLPNVVDPVGCLQACVARGLAACNAVSVPKASAGYQACHLWKVTAAATMTANPNFRSMKVGCITSDAQATAACSSLTSCANGACAAAGPPPTAGPPPPQTAPPPPTGAPPPPPTGAPPPPPTGGPPGTCSDAWTCGMVWEGTPATGAVAPSPPYGYLPNIVDPIPCLQACVARGLAACNAVSVPKASAGYQACHLWKVTAAATMTANANFRSIKLSGCITTDAEAASTCNSCDGTGSCSPGAPPTPPGPPPPGGQGNVAVAPAAVSFGLVDLDASKSVAVTLTNQGGSSVSLTGVTCNAGAANSYLTIELPGGVSITCGAALGSPVSLPTGDSTVTLTFTPSGNVALQAAITFSGVSGAFGTVTASGTGGDPYAGGHTLHPVIEVQPLYMVPGGGSKYVTLQGQESHTHGPGDKLVSWVWKNMATGVTSSSVNYGANFAQGTYTFQLTITDQKGGTESTQSTFTVASESNVPGTYIRVYDTTMHTSLPAGLMPVFADVTTGFFSVSSNEYKDLSNSPYVLRLYAKISSTVAFNPSFVVKAVNSNQDSKIQGSTVLLNGAAPGSGQEPAGTYTLDVRVLIADPVSIVVELNGSPIGASNVDISQEPPIINKINSGTSAASGVSGSLQGFLVRSPASVSVGGIAATITGQSDTSIQFTYPGGLTAGSNPLVVTRDGKTSNPIYINIKDFGQATPQGGPFSSVTKFTQKTAKSGGSDHTASSVARVVWCNGHLFASSAYSGGTIWHYTCTENWDCTYVDEKQVAASPYTSILGLACDPWENDGNMKLWFAHNHLYAQGGAQPTSFAEYKGRISYVQWFKAGKPVTLVVKNLAVSNHDHAVNDLGFLHDGDLLITTASNTNAGIITGPLGWLPENPTSTGIWRVNVRASGFNGNLQYQWLKNAPTSYVNGNNPNDQRYGEWAELVPNPNFQLFAPGARNPFGLEIRSKGKIMMTQNGPNFEYGKQMTGISAGCTKSAASRSADECKEQQAADPASSDSVYLDVKEGDYYGSPNAARCRKWLIDGVGNKDECVFTNVNDVPASPPSCSAGVINGCTLKKPDIILESSLGGPFEYISYAFGGSWMGQIIIPSLQSSSWRYDADNDVAVQDNQDPNYPYSEGVDAQQGPGGCHIFAAFSSNTVKVNCPDDATVAGNGNPSVYDMAPTKSAVGLTGKEFIIGGVNFNNMQSVTVKIGSLTVTPTFVGTKWIKGQLPTGYSMTGNSGVDCNIDVSVQYTDKRTGSPGTLTLPGIFCWLPSKPSACSACGT